MTDKVKVLPRVMSELIRIALRDVEKAEKAEGVVLNMFDWHISLHDGSCSMCAAGAVARFGVGEIKSGENWHPFHSDVNFRQYCAIDFLRDGSVCVAASELNINLNPSVDDFYVISPYSESPDKWKADMESLATKLEDAGL